MTVDGALVSRMLSEHGLWTDHLLRAIESADTDPTASLPAEDECAMGRWLNAGAGALDPGVRAEVADLHRRFHDGAAELLTLAAAGDRDRALAAAAPGGAFSVAANSLAVTVERLRPDGQPPVAVPAKTAGDELLGSVSLVRAEVEVTATATGEIADLIHHLRDDVGDGLSAITEIAGAAGTTAQEADQGRARSEEAQQLLVGVRESVARISESLALIAQIASKTNIIVLNANIEAARAGEAGRGFGIVANEVKQLADGISTATREVRGITDVVQQDTDTILGDVDGVRTSIGRIVESQAAITGAIDRQQSMAERMRAGLTTAAESIDVIESTAASAARGARGAVAVSSVLAERLRSISTATGHPTRRFQVRGARGWFLTPDLAHLVECAAGHVTYYAAATGQVVGELRPQHAAEPAGGGTFVNPDGRLVFVSWDPAGAFRLWDVGTGAAGCAFQNGGTPRWVAVDEENWRLVAPTGRMAQVGRYRREVATVWDLRTGTAVEDVAVDDLDAGYHPRSVADSFATEAVTADQHLYATGAAQDDGATLVLYDGRTGRERFRTVEAEADGVRAAFDAEGTLLFAHWEAPQAGWVDVFDL